MNITIYTDGACKGNPGPGGYAALLTTATHSRLIGGAEVHTTNNRMELRAAIEGLAALKHPEAHTVTIITDSRYVVDIIDGTSTKPKANLDLVAQLRTLTAQTASTSAQWVRGHAGNPYNEQVDRYASHLAETVTPYA